MARSKNYKDLLIESLKDPKEAVGYLNAILEDYKDNDEESQRVLLAALKDIAEAQGGIAELIEIIESVKSKACEKKVIAEVENIEQAIMLCKSGIDGIQFDKVPYDDLKSYIDTLRNINPSIVVLASGGINESNIEDYAKTGANAIVTTSVYHAKPIDIGCKITKL